MWWGWVKNSFFVSLLPQKLLPAPSILPSSPYILSSSGLTRGSIAWSVLLSLLLLLTSCSISNQPDKAKLYVASSLAVLADEMERLAKDYGSVEPIFLSSSGIARQIAQGASCDAVVLADEKWVQFLLQKQVVEPHSRLLAKNSLVLVGPNKYAPTSVEQAFPLMPPSAKLIIGDPDFVPLGAYTAEALKNMGLYTVLKNQFLSAHSARHASILLSQKASSWAIAYRTDAVPENLHVIATIDPKLHRTIEYPFMRCKKSRLAQANALEKLLFSQPFQKAMRAKGFIL